MKDVDPNIIVYFDNRFVPLAEAKVSVLTHALNYGTGIFEGIRGYWDEKEEELFVVRVEEHYHRWLANCRILRMELPLNPAQLSELTAELIRRNRFHDNVYVRPLAYKSSARIGVHPDNKDAFAIVALPFGDYLDSRRGLRVAVSSWRRVEDNAIPGRGKICGAYVNSALAGDEARHNGYDEALLLTEDGHVCEGSAANIFLVRDGALITPPVTDNILEGITRASVMELARREMGLEVIERRVDRSELYIADEAFFTGTAVEIAPIVRVDDRPIGAGQVGLVATALRQFYSDAVRGRLSAYRHWLTPAYHHSSVAAA